MNRNHLLIRIVVSLAALALLIAGAIRPAQARQMSIPASGSSLGFTYQGQLQKSGSPYTGACDFVFTLWDSASGGLQQGGADTLSAVPVTNGLFSVTLNDSNQFGAGALDGAARYLDITVKCSGDSSAVPLGRQKLTAAPYALTKQQADGYYLNTTGPDVISGNSSSAILTVIQSGTGHGLSASSTAYQTAGVFGQGVYAGVWGTSTGGYPGSGVTGLGVNGSLGGYFRTDSPADDSLLVDGNARVNKNLRVDGTLTTTNRLYANGGFTAPLTRYVPITVGDMMTSQGTDTGDFNPGVLYPAGTSSGGAISFPLPADYQPGTSLTLDLYITPLASASGMINFYVRWAGISNGGSGNTGVSFVGSPVAAPTTSTVTRQTITLPSFSPPLPDYVMLTIRRDSGYVGAKDTFSATVALQALRLAYTATR